MHRAAQTSEQRAPADLRGWSLSKNGRSCIVTARHATPGRARLAQILAWWSTLALLAFPAWYCWGWKNIPDPLRVTVNLVAAKLGSYSLTFDQRKWVYVGLWVSCCLAWRLWEWLFYRVYRAAMTRRTTVLFTARQIILYRLGRRARRYDRTSIAPIAFFLTPHPELAWLELKARRRGSERLTVFYQQTRFLFMQRGPDLVPVAAFISPESAQGFAARCQFAIDYPLEPEPSVAATACRKTRSEILNEPDT